MSRAFEDILRIVQEPGGQVIIKASYMEIYNEEIRDLLALNPKQKLALHEKPKTGVYVAELSEHVV